MKKLLWLLACALSFYTHAQAPLQIVKEDYNRKKELYKEPAFFGSRYVDLANYLFEYIAYPPSVKERRIEGDMLISFAITEQGIVDKVQIRRSLDNELDALVIGAFKNMPKWQPAIANGEALESERVFWINFQLNANPFIHFDQSHLFGIGITGNEMGGLPYFSTKDDETAKKRELFVTKNEGSNVQGRKRIRIERNVFHAWQLESDSIFQVYTLDDASEDYVFMAQFRTDSTKRGRKKFEYVKTLKLNYDDIKAFRFKDDKEWPYTRSVILWGVGVAAALVILVSPWLNEKPESYQKPATWGLFAGFVATSYLGYRMRKNIKPRIYTFEKDWTLKSISQ